MPGLSIPILALVASAILFAPLASWLALQRARSAALWFLFGVALGPVAALLLVLAPPGQCPACGTRTVGWPRSCANCGLTLGTRLAPAVRPAAATAGGPGPGPGGSGSTATDTPMTAAPAATAASAVMATAEPARARRTRRPAAGKSERRSANAAPATASPPAEMPSSENGELDPSRRPATVLGHRPSEVAAALPAAPPPAPRRAPAGTLAILGSGVFIGGNVALQVGSRYLLARVGAELHILGPVHINPAAVALRISLAGIEPTLVADRLVISRTPPGRAIDLAFGGVSLERDVDVARDLRAPRQGGSTTS